MALGEEDAHNLGVDVERVKKILFFSASLLTACAVSISGIVGFVRAARSAFRARSRRRG